MDVTKFKVLWEYAIPARTKATAEDLLRLCMMFLSSSSELADEVKQQLQSQCEKTIETSTAPNNKALLDVVLADASFTTLVTSLIAQQAANAPPAPKTALKSILDQVDDDDDEGGDSSVQSGSSSGSEEEGEEEDEEAPPPVAASLPPVVMKGFIKRAAPKVEWSGNWALNHQAFEQGDKAKFRFDSPDLGFTFDSENKSVVGVPKSPTLWEGSFLIKDVSAQGGFTRVDEKDITIEFIEQAKGKWTLAGRGSNANGTFTLEGELDGASRRMALLKTITFHNQDANKKKKKRRTDVPSSEDEVEDGEDEIDPTELADLERDQREQDLKSTKKQRRV
ncbi:hypothetical protein BASA81_001303 [Batrachochytrium salamandrivorans]|nr:hypothetical protein BASA81_001303 [Batrachochytrium salamandrivorans]